MALCLLLPELLLLRRAFPYWAELALAALFLAGTAAALVWFRPRGDRTRRPLPRGLLPLLSGVALAFLVVLGVLWSLATGAWQSPPAGLYGYEILHRVRETVTDTQESAVYALLRGLCRDGDPQQYGGSVSGGLVRKYYPKRDRLAEAWRRLRDTLAVLGVE